MYGVNTGGLAKKVLKVLASNVWPVQKVSGHLGIFWCAREKSNTHTLTLDIIRVTLSITLSFLI
jgi:hypothetical protein